MLDSLTDMRLTRVPVRGPGCDVVLCVIPSFQFANSIANSCSELLGQGPQANLFDRKSFRLVYEYNLCSLVRCLPWLPDSAREARLQGLPQQ
jgi:hypothetical protein